MWPTGAFPLRDLWHVGVNMESGWSMLCGECRLLEQACRSDGSRCEISTGIHRDLYLPRIISDGKSIMFALPKN